MLNEKQKVRYSPDIDDIKLAAIMGEMGGNCRKVTLQYMGSRLNMSAPAISGRLDKMIKKKFIKGITADINLKMVYPELTSGIIAIYLNHRADKRELKRFVESCVYVQKSYDGRDGSDYIFEITAPDWRRFNEVYHDLGALNSVDKVKVLATFGGGVEHHNHAELLHAV